MTAMSRLAGAVFRLPKPETRDVQVERGLRVPMRDGTVLLADRWYPKVVDGERRPVLVSRSPYGRTRDGLNGRLFAERGYQALVVSCRGTFGSGGEFEPFRNEADDGQDTFAWLASQPWCPGPVGTFGGSYVGMTQWAVAKDPPESLAAIAPAVTTANFNELFYPGGTFALATTVNWVHVVAHQEESAPRRLWSLVTGAKPIRAGVHASPISEADVAAVGHRVPWYREWLDHPDPGDDWWSAVRWRDRLERTPPATLVAGWYDLFLPHQLADYEALRSAGRDVELTVGPWHHLAPALNAEMLRTTLTWMDRHLRGRPAGSARRSPVRIRPIGEKRWLDLESWPPPSEPVRWHLQPGGRLAVDLPPPSQPDRYRYDPADPTPVKGGATLDARNLGSKRQAAVEGRPDVLRYTSAPLDADLTVIGPVTAEIHVRSERPHTDVFVRLCAVDPKGTSRNLCDGVRRTVVPDIDGPTPVAVELFPTAYTFRKGFRIRVQVASGAFPSFSTIPGSAGWREVHHDPEHPSVVTLPVLAGGCAKL